MTNDDVQRRVREILAKAETRAPVTIDSPDMLIEDRKGTKAGGGCEGLFEFFENDRRKSNVTRGGKCPGAGRKQGPATKRTREIADKAVTSGMTPLEVMIRAKTNALLLLPDQKSNGNTEESNRATRESVEAAGC